MHYSFPVYISLIALLLAIINFIFALINRRNDLATRKRNDFIESENLLDKAYDNLYGTSGYKQTKNIEKLNEAKSLINRANKLTPQYARVTELEGLCFYSEGKPKKAFESYLEAVKLGSERWQLYNNLGLISEGETAMKYYAKAIRFDSDNSGLPLYNMGLEYLKQNEPEKAKLHFESTLKHTPKNSNALYQLGKIYRDEGDVNQSRKFLEKAIAANPKHIDAIVSLGAMLAEIGDWENGFSWLEHARKINPEDAYPLAMMAALYGDKKMYPEAMKYYNLTINIDPAYKFTDSSLRDLYEEIKQATSSPSKIE